MNISCEITFRPVSQETVDIEPALAKIMAWCRDVCCIDIANRYLDLRHSTKQV